MLQQEEGGLPVILRGENSAFFHLKIKTNKTGEFEEGGTIT